MRKSFAEALSDFRACRTDGDAAGQLVDAFRAAMGLRARPDDVERTALAALDEVPPLIQAELVLLVHGYLEQEIEGPAVLEEIAELLHKWRYTLY